MFGTCHPTMLILDYSWLKWWVTFVQDVANIIGHNDIRSTLKYSRYAMSKKEIQGLLETIENTKPDKLI